MSGIVHFADRPEIISVSPPGTVVYETHGSKSCVSKTEHLVTLGRTMAYANYIWVIFQLCLLASNYYFNTLDFGTVPGVTILGAVADQNEKSLTTARIAQLTFAFVVYQVMHLVLADMYLRGINDVDLVRLDWFSTAYSFTFGVEILIVLYGLCALDYGLTFAVSCFLYCAFKSYSILVARRAKKHYKKVLNQEAEIARLQVDALPKIIAIRKSTLDNRAGIALI